MRIAEIAARFITFTAFLAKSLFAGRGIVGAALLLSVAACSQESHLSGKVIAIDNGLPVAQASVTLVSPEGVAGPATITVFTASDGAFAFPDSTLSKKMIKNLTSDTLYVQKIGLGQIPYKAADSEASLLKKADAKTYQITLFVEPVGNIADKVPASAWLKDAPDGAEKNILITSCTSCHQIPSPRMRNYAALVEAVRNGPEGDTKALEEWRKVVRHEAWRTIAKYMRPKHYAVFPLESAVSIDAIDWQTALNEDLNFFTGRQAEVVAQFLADSFPHSTKYMSAGAYGFGAPLGVNEKTVIREFAFPEKALVRELVGAPNSPYAWGADVKRNLIVRLDPATGKTKWYPVEFDGSTGPHTIVPDDEGKIWVSMIDNDQFGRFDPATEEWTLWTLRPSNLPNADSIAGSAIVHDMSIDSRGHLAKDPDGKIWLTIVGTNQMGTLSPDTGEVAFYDTNTIEGLSPINHLLYSTVISEDGGCAWYSQINGHVGCIDTSTKKLKILVKFEEGDGPRRMARDNAGHLWVALFGKSAVAKIDAMTGDRLATFPLPDTSAAPYAVTWDERRQCVWVANANSDVIYKMNPDTGDILVYPLPRSMAYMRQISIDPETGNLIGAYANYPEGSGPSMGFIIDIGDD